MTCIITETDGTLIFLWVSYGKLQKTYIAEVSDTCNIAKLSWRGIFVVGSRDHKWRQIHHVSRLLVFRMCCFQNHHWRDTISTLQNGTGKILVCLQFLLVDVTVL